MSGIKISSTDIAGVGTIITIFGMSLYLLTQHRIQYANNLGPLYLGFLVYLSSFIIATREKKWFSQNKIYFVIALQLISAFFIMWNYPIEFLPILTIIWVSILPFYVSLRASFIAMTIVVICWFSLYGYLWGEGVSAAFSGILYGTFHVFSILMTHHAREAEKATEKANLLNEELKSTQQLLTEASKQNERTRIARDLHDLLGHHLTALIINLQVAEHLSAGEAKDKIEQCHSLAKLLMSDVREAVSSLREANDLDFEKLVLLLVNNLPNLTIHTQIDTQITRDNIDLAKTLLSCIQEASTNCLKHANANEFWISLKQQDQSIRLELYDNGQIDKDFSEGNGLTGMRERVKEHCGNIELSIVQRSLRIRIELPISRVQSGA